MCEMLYIKIIANLLDKNVLLSNFKEDELSELLRIKADKSLDINTIDVEVKKEIDRVVLKYGLLDSLKRLIILKRDAIDLQEKYRENGRLPCDIRLCSFVITEFYERIERVYLADVYLRLYTLFIQIKNGTFDRDKMLNSILNPVSSVSDLLGLDQTVGIQETLFDIDDDKNPMAPVINSYWTRDKVSSEVKRYIRNFFTPKEISEYLRIISTSLKTDPVLEHYIFSRALRKIKPELQKKVSRRTSEVKDSAQMKIAGF